MKPFHAVNGSFVYSNLLFIEECLMNLIPSPEWMKNNWTKTLYINAAYLISLYFLHQFMKNKNSHELKISLIVWNVLMASYSIFGTWRSLPDTLYIFKRFGIQTAICEVETVDIRLVSGWCRIFALCKILELGDTYLMVLQKKSITFSHLIHHMLALTITWYYYGHTIGISYVFVAMNYFVHSFMFSYLMLKAVGFKIPRFIPMAITLLHIIEMFTGFSFSFLTLKNLLNNKPCIGDYFASYSGCVMYGINFILFTRYFFHSYIFKTYTKYESKSKKIT